MTEQELIQENEKLNARLQKAVTVFNDQKATIQRLTKERDDAKADLSQAQETINELEKKLAESAQDETFFHQVEEISNLNESLKKERTEKEEAQTAHDIVLKELEQTKTNVAKIQNHFTEQLHSMEEAFAEMCNEVI